MSVRLLQQLLQRATHRASLSRAVGIHAKAAAHPSPEENLAVLGDEGKERVRSLLNDADRFQSIDQRANNSVLPLAATKSQCFGRSMTQYRGYDIRMAPEEFVIYQQLFLHTKPSTIVKIGIKSAASALWMTDMLNLCPPTLVKPQVYGVVRSSAEGGNLAAEVLPDNLHLIHGDWTNIEDIVAPDIISKMHRPLVVIYNGDEMDWSSFNYLHTHLQPGDYLIMENTNPALHSDHSILRNVQQFLMRFKDCYAIDSFYTDFFGYNATSNWNGFIRRMK